MDHLRSIFELFSGKTTKITEKQVVTKRPKQTGSNANVQRSSKSSTKTNSSKSQTTTTGKSNQKAQVNTTQATNSASHSTSSRSTSSSHLANVFAPRLNHLASQVTNEKDMDNEARWVSIKEMAGNGYHCAAYLIHCTEHNKVAVTKPSASQAMWMPFTAIPPNQSWDENGKTGLLIVLSGKLKF